MLARQVKIRCHDCVKDFPVKKRKCTVCSPPPPIHCTCTLHRNWTSGWIRNNNPIQAMFKQQDHPPSTHPERQTQPEEPTNHPPPAIQQVDSDPTGTIKHDLPDDIRQARARPAQRGPTWDIFGYRELTQIRKGGGTIQDALKTCKTTQNNYVIWQGLAGTNNGDNNLTFARRIGNRFTRDRTEKTHADFENFRHIVSFNHRDHTACTITKIADYHAAQARHAHDLNTHQHSTNHAPKPNNRINFASDFSGMDSETYVTKKVRNCLSSTQMWASEKAEYIRYFPTVNYTSHQIFTDVTTRPPAPGQLHFYADGHPCQSLSPAGLRRDWKDPRSRLYMQTIFTIETTQPDTFPTEKAGNLRYIAGGKNITNITNMLR